MPKDEKGVHLLADYDYLDTWKVCEINSFDLWGFSQSEDNPTQNFSNLSHFSGNGRITEGRGCEKYWCVQF